jgi:hypothetical protein
VHDLASTDWSDVMKLDRVTLWLIPPFLLACAPWAIIRMPFDPKLTDETGPFLVFVLSALAYLTVGPITFFVLSNGASREWKPSYFASVFFVVAAPVLAFQFIFANTLMQMLYPFVMNLTPQTSVKVMGVVGVVIYTMILGALFPFRKRGLSVTAAASAVASITILALLFCPYLVRSWWIRTY